MGLVECDGDRIDAVSTLTQSALGNPLRELVGDVLREPLRGRVDARELRFFVEIAVVEHGQDLAQLLRGESDVDNDVVRIELSTFERSVHQERCSMETLCRTEDLAAETVGDHHVIADGDAEQDDLRCAVGLRCDLASERS